MMKKVVAFLLFLAFATAGCTTGSKKIGLTASGTIEANEITVAAEISGKVEKVLVSEGDTVKKDQEVARLDDSVLQWQVKQAEAGARAAEAKLGETKKGNRVEQIRQAESSVLQVQALLTGAKAALSSARSDYDRIKDLFEQGAAPQQQMDGAKAKLDEAKSQLEALESQFRAAQEQAKLVKAGATAETISAADAVFNQNVAAWEAAKAQLAKAVVYAPADGVITEKIIESGEYVNPGTGVAIITDLKNLWVEVYIAEADLGKVNIGQDAQVFVDAFPGKEFKGKVTYIAQEAEFTPKNVQTKEERTNMVFLVKISVDNEKAELKPGMPVDVVFP